MQRFKLNSIRCAHNALSKLGLRVDRGDFSGSFRAKLKTPGESSYLKNNNVFAVHWRDKRDVFVMSSIDGSFSEVVERKGGQEPIETPSIITNYKKKT